jgi:outer membrane putative beta-barrel porin/alpha-amylase
MEADEVNACAGRELMSKAATLVLVLFASLSTYSLGQALGGPCPTSNSTNQTIAAVSPDLICVVPQVYGAGGLVGVPNNGPLGSTNQNSAAFKHSVHFQTAALASFSPLTAAIGTQLSQLPITSPASGFLFTFNPSVGVVTETTQNFGPILSERAQTIGKHKLFVGFSYQYFDFDKVDGVSLRNFGAVFHHEFEACPSPNPNNISCFNNGTTNVVAITQDFISTQNRIDLKVHQFVAVGTFGMTNRLDLSVAIPILDVRTDMTSDATIQNIENTNVGIIPQCCVHVFSPSPLPGETLFPAITASSNGLSYNNHALFRRASSASGIGDVVFRGKFQAWQGEKAGLAVAIDARIPTGDESNFLGSGTWGVRPFVAFSYSGRVSPHANLGVQINGNSILAGDVTTNTKAQLPNVINYTAGVDVGITRRLSISADFLGLALQNEKKVSQATPVPDFTGGAHPDIATSTATINQASIAVGGKVSPFGRLLISANVLFRVNDAGLHYKPAPLVGVSYSF